MPPCCHKGCAARCVAAQSRMSEEQKAPKLSFAPFLLPAEPFASNAGGRGNRKKTRQKGQTKRERGWVSQPGHVSVSTSLPSEADVRELEVSSISGDIPAGPHPHPEAPYGRADLAALLATNVLG